MLKAIAIIPSAAVLVPELAGAAAAEIADLRHAVCAAAAALPDRWIAVGLDRADTVVGPDATGSFGGYGADIRIGLSSQPGEAAPMPLCALITGWVRGQLRPTVRAEVRVYAADHDADAALERGRRLRAEIDGTAEPVGVLIVADGAHTLTPGAPGGFDPGAAGTQRVLDDALADGDAAALLRLPAGITGRVAWQILAGLAEPAPRSAKELYRGAPFGVGYFAGVWSP